MFSPLSYYPISLLSHSPALSLFREETAECIKDKTKRLKIQKKIKGMALLKLGLSDDEESSNPIVSRTQETSATKLSDGPQTQ